VYWELLCAAFDCALETYVCAWVGVPLWEEVCVLVLCSKPSIYLPSLHIFWRPECHHIWIIVMRSIQDNCVSFIFVLSGSILTGSLIFYMHCSTCVENVWLYASACIGTMHVHVHIEGLSVYAGIPSLASFCMYLHESRAERASAFLGLYWGTSVYLHSVVCIESWVLLCVVCM